MLNFIILFWPEFQIIMMFLIMIALFSIVYYRFYLPATLMFRLREFFRIRDDLIYLIATDPSKRNDYLINHYVEYVNVFIRYGRVLNLEKILNTFFEKSKENESQAGNKLEEELAKASPEIRELTKQFNREAVRFIIFNSSIGSITRLIFKAFGIIFTVAFYFSWLKVKAYFMPEATYREKEILNYFDQMDQKYS